MYVLTFQLFDKENYVNKNPHKFLFTTEGHIFPLLSKYRKKPWEDLNLGHKSTKPTLTPKPQQSEVTQDQLMPEGVVVDVRANHSTNVSHIIAHV